MFGPLLIVVLNYRWQGSRGIWERHHTDQHDENAENPLDWVVGADVSVAYGCDGGKGKVEGCEIESFSIFVVWEPCGLGVGHFYVSSDDPKARNDMANHDEHKNENKEPFESYGELQKILKLLLNELSAFDDFEDSD